ncbi:MAG TPA: dihydrolipoamide acetyltransferase family protein, partial [Bacteroidota bacterium]|nr:dihydrolipoamide acetyltransferase family protein [Bacteroidota bacterium]
KMGESIQEGKILRWMKKVGEKIQKDETILEISTDKVDSEIPSPTAGILAKIVVQEQETVPVGAVIAYVETDANARVVSSTVAPAPVQEPRTSAPDAPAALSHPARTVVVSTPKTGNGSRFYSPLVRTIAKSEGLSTEELDVISGSGATGRVTKKDVLSYLQQRSKNPSASARPETVIRKTDLGELQKKYAGSGYRIQQMDNVQQKMAEHMLRSVATSPHVAAVDEADVTSVVNFRARHADAFEKREGYKLTFTPFFASAIVSALKEFPVVNSSVEGDKVIYKNFINLGIAVASPGGLLVPNIRNAEEKNFLGLARSMNDLAVRTRNRKLLPDEVQGGTFTISNYGVFGTIIGTPIINQPQVAILGIGAIKKRPVVITGPEGDDLLGIRSMVYLTMSFDHRIIDGAIAGQFLSKIRTTLEHFDFGKTF